MLSKILLNCALVLAVWGAPSAIVPLQAKGPIGFIQNLGGSNEFRIYYQPKDGTINTGISEVAVSGPFDTGRVFRSGGIVPANEVLQGTPVSAINLDQPPMIRVFFLSPNRTLSEALWTPATGPEFISGSKCPQCITSKHYPVAEGQNILPASVNIVTGTISVAYVDAISTETLSEAVMRSGSWQSVPMQNNN